MERTKKRKISVKQNNEGLMNRKKESTHAAGPNAVGLSIETGWHKMDGTVIEDLEKYVYDYMGAQDKLDIMEIMIGTDGLEKGMGGATGIVKLLTVICFRKVGKGAHIIKRKEDIMFARRIKTAEKLNMEVNKTCELVIYLKSIGINPIVHLDLNPKDTEGSFQVYTAVKGWFESMGCVVSYKPDANAASYGADYFL